MYTNFRIQNYRGFKDLELKDLTRVNLIGGKNNVGKTSLLEALFILMNPYNPELLLRVNAHRGIRQVRFEKDNIQTPLDSLFYGFDAKNAITLSATTTSDQKYRFDIAIALDSEQLEIETASLADISQEAISSLEFNASVPIRITDNEGNTRLARVIAEDDSVRYMIPKTKQRHPSYFFPSIVREPFQVIAERYSKIVEVGQESLILETLKYVEPRIKSIRLLYQNGEPLLTADVGSGKQIPLTYMGDGLNRLLQFILAIGNANGGIVFIDEIENGLHYSVLIDTWIAIQKAAELFDTQIVTTTHSLEMIRAAQQAFAHTGEDDFRYYRIDRHPETGDPLAVKYAPETIDFAVEMNYEVRG
ncbi:MAG: AAA family ATPase [Phototrophicaceae bacterium]